jgi:hypothetical protein
MCIIHIMHVIEKMIFFNVTVLPEEVMVHQLIFY